MYSFYIDGEDIKKFMNIFLKENLFDKFEVRSCEVTTFVTFNIDCRVNKEWFEETHNGDYCLWKELRPYIYNIIKGKKKPKNMKFVMSLSPSALEKLHPNALACFLNIVFEEDKVSIVTGTAQKEFSLDKSLEIIWGEKIKDFFENIKITQNII